MRFTKLITLISYIGVSGRRLEERLMNHAGREKNLHVLKHSSNNGNKEVTIDDVTIMSKTIIKLL